MASFVFQKDELAHHSGTSFVPLGLSTPQPDFLAAKLSKLKTSKEEEVWGTVGFADDSPFDLKGEIKFSEKGNLASVGATGKIVSELKTFYPSINEQTKLIERYINFDHVEFDLADAMDLESLRNLRLTVFLEPHESVVAYYEHHKKGNHADSEAEIEFILQEKEREIDRATFIFNILPPYEIDLDDEATNLIRTTHTKTTTSFTIKILVFEIVHQSQEGLLKTSFQNINIFNKSITERIGDRKYALLQFSSLFSSVPENGGGFIPINENDIDVSLKTLLLLHGTISNTHKSFRGLLERRIEYMGKSFLQVLLDEGIYDQILAFDHPTITEDAEENVLKLLTHFLPNTSFGLNKLDVMACSRGAILAECLSGIKEAKGKLEINKVLMVAPANGVNYFSLSGMMAPAQMNAAFISVLRLISGGGSMGKVVLVLAQLSVQFLASLPGFDQMKPGSNRLNKILDLEPNNYQTVYKCVVADWSISHSKGSLFKRSGAFLLDRVIALILGKEHDWVVGCTSQRISPAKSPKAKTVEVQSIHSRYLLLENVPEMHGIIKDYFRNS